VEKNSIILTNSLCYVFGGRFSASIWAIAITV